MNLRILAYLIITSSLLSANSAVSDLNGKFSASYGSEDSRDQGIVSGAVSGPIGESLGYQFDGLYSEEQGDLSHYGVGAHLFWRDNEQGLVGLSVGALDGDLYKAYEVSLELEYYFDWLTLGVRGGWASIDYEAGLIHPSIDTEDDGAYGHIYATVYPLEDLAVTLGGQHRYDLEYATLDLEYELPKNGLSLFASASIGENDYEQFNVGVRYYFGGDKSLKARHREDDPRNIVVDLHRGAGVYRTKVEHERQEYIEDLIRRVRERIPQSFIGAVNPVYYNDPLLIEAYRYLSQAQLNDLLFIRPIIFPPYAPYSPYNLNSNYFRDRYLSYYSPNNFVRPTPPPLSFYSGSSFSSSGFSAVGF